MQVDGIKLGAFIRLAVLLVLPAALSCNVTSAHPPGSQETEDASHPADDAGVSACTPDCACKLCGEDDGCGGRCFKPCFDPNHVCLKKERVCCSPDCEGKICGDADGCGAICTACQDGTTCDPSTRTCKAPCTPACDGWICGDDDGCGGRCTRCPKGQACNEKDWMCENRCVPTCDQKRCGEDDGCGGRCKACDTGEDCSEITWKCQSCSLPDAGVIDDGGTVGCLLKVDCPVTQWCNIDTRTCMEMGSCDEDLECALGHVCNAYTKLCECLDDRSCKGWPDGRTSCDPGLKRCDPKTTQTCVPSCDPGCKECRNGVCELLAGRECCGDNDCYTAPRLYCDSSTHTCYERHACADVCTTDADCRDWCGSADYRCSGTACVAQECATDAACDAICGTTGGSTCIGGSCHCAIQTGHLCGDCSTDPTICDAAGMKCGTFTKTCTISCTDASDCVSAYGQVYTCNTMVKICDCQSPSCCSPPCQAGQTCDEGATCTCQ